jgi:hypothetical protein
VRISKLAYSLNFCPKLKPAIYSVSFSDGQKLHIDFLYALRISYKSNIIALKRNFKQFWVFLKSTISTVWLNPDYLSQEIDYLSTICQNVNFW